MTANTEMTAAWDGPEGQHWAENADRYERVGDGQRARLLEAAAVSPTDVVLDIGCGTGAATRAAALAAPEGSAVGFDLSSKMLELAREKAAQAGIANVTFQQDDVQVHDFPAASFSLAISAMGVMFFDDPVAAFANIGRALQPGGRIAMLAWRDLEQNEWQMTIRAALAVGRSLPSPPARAPGPFGFADPEYVRHVIGTAGFTAVDLTPSDEPAFFGADADDAYDFISSFGITRGLTQDLSDTDRRQALDNLRQVVEDNVAGSGVEFTTSAWLITATWP